MPVIEARTAVRSPMSIAELRHACPVILHVGSLQEGSQHGTQAFLKVTGTVTVIVFGPSDADAAERFTVH